MVGTQIRMRRKALNMTQDMLSKDLCDRSYLSKVEANKVSPTLEFLEKIAVRLQWNLGDMIGEEQKGLNIINAVEIRRMIRNQDYETLWKSLEMLWWQSADRRSPLLQQSIFTVLKSIKGHMKSSEDLYSIVMSLMFHGLSQGVNENIGTIVNFMCQMLYEANEYIISVSLARAFLSLSVTEAEKIEIFLGMALNLIELEDWSRAVEYYLAVLDRLTSHNPILWKAKALHGISTCEIYQENWQAAFQAAQRASQLYFQSGNDALGWLAKQNAAISLCAENKLEHGLALLQSCDQYWNAQQAHANQINVLDDLVGVWQRIGDQQSIYEVVPRIRELQSELLLPDHLQKLINHEIG